eukprot:3988115-Prorocentrum_lima.AAC.1
MNLQRAAPSPCCWEWSPLSPFHEALRVEELLQDGFDAIDGVPVSASSENVPSEEDSASENLSHEADEIATDKGDYVFDFA